MFTKRHPHPQRRFCVTMMVYDPEAARHCRWFSASKALPRRRMNKLRRYLSTADQEKLIRPHRDAPRNPSPVAEVANRRNRIEPVSTQSRLEAKDRHEHAPICLPCLISGAGNSPKRRKFNASGEKATAAGTCPDGANAHAPLPCPAERPQQRLVTDLRAHW